MANELEQIVLSKAQQWLDGDYDEATKAQVKCLMESDMKELTESFYKDMEFGTAGLRGIMGVGTNRMNIYTVGTATQGLANYLKKTFEGEQVRVGVAHDSRNNSRLFAERVADIFASNGFKVYLFDDLRPVPELSFTIRELKLHSGVVITASHNPKEYNGYKAYWGDGAQVTPPHDTNIIDEVAKITKNSQVLTGMNPENIEILGEEFDKRYIDRIKNDIQLSPESVEKFHDMKIVYTPLHGAGVRLVPMALRSFGFTNIHVVPEQAVVDGNFPTVESPNPEERKTMLQAMELGRQEGADLVLATDPDADRIGVALRTGTGEYVLLNGNQTLALLLSYQLTRWAERGELDGNQYVIKTIVTSQMANAVAAHFGVKCYDCLTGFKYIAKIIRENEGKAKYIGGGEESFGYLAGDYVRDKDAVSACALAAEAAAWAKDTMGLTLYEWLQQLYVKYGFYRESLVSLVRKGKEGAEEIQQIMVSFRTTPPKELAGSEVLIVRDYKSLEETNMRSGVKTPIDQDSSNVLQWITADGTIVSVRPSGTEPKIKFYFGVKADLPSVEQFDEVQAQLDAKIEQIKKDLNLI
ncbi:MAG: phospho-sugar mutase [Alistipes sp.]|nr:phospho-sugar mutase [Rikenellaceae bacterium]MBP3474374.1 phospho-sugar mutase [Alistipes sp.]MBR2072879.1 phospho-sugar mutase [Alistipes sp.]MBR3793732.1 phospho-sugar mutase [Alistipes sp.]MBR7115635.1 phospho-sugar mutase [Alistipes sp.]